MLSKALCQRDRGCGLTRVMTRTLQKRIRNRLAYRITAFLNISVPLYLCVLCIIYTLCTFAAFNNSPLKSACVSASTALRATVCRFCAGIFINYWRSSHVFCQKRLPSASPFLSSLAVSRTKIAFYTSRASGIAPVSDSPRPSFRS